MMRIWISTIVVLGLMFACGCASQMESANQGVGQAGQTVGGVSRLPNSFSEGAAKGVAGQPSPNPYNR
jgi:hypothetical protein